MTNKQIAEAILELSKSYVPVDTGALRNSGLVEDRNGVYTVSFGSGLDYGVYVHEIYDNRHTNGRAKYLEDAAYEIMNRLQIGNNLPFTFKMVFDGQTVKCEINTLTESEFIKDRDEQIDKFKQFVYSLFNKQNTNDSGGGSSGGREDAI